MSLASVEQIVARFGHVAAVREDLLARDDLPMSLRQALLSKLSQTLAGFVVERQWLGPDHAEYAAREACEKATVALAADTPYDELGDLVRHLRQSGQLTAGMLLRALLSGNVVLLEESLGELTELPLERVASLLHDKTMGGLRALYRKAALPELAYPAFRAALAGLREGYAIGEPGGAARLKRRLTERVLMLCSEGAASRACSRCCVGSRWKPHAKRLGCSATNSCPISRSCRVRPRCRRYGWSRERPAHQASPSVGALICLRTSGR